MAAYQWFKTYMENAVKPFFEHNPRIGWLLLLLLVPSAAGNAYLLLGLKPSTPPAAGVVELVPEHSHPLPQHDHNELTELIERNHQEAMRFIGKVEGKHSKHMKYHN